MTEPNSPTGVCSVPFTAVPRRRRSRSILLAIFLLLCGAVIGSGLTLVFVVHHVQYAIHHPNEFPARATAKLRRQLKLSDEQARAVEAILQKRQASLQAIRRVFQPQVEAQLNDIQREIAEVLTPEQAGKWNQWVAARRQTWLPSLPPPDSLPSSRPAKE